MKSGVFPDNQNTLAKKVLEKTLLQLESAAKVWGFLGIKKWKKGHMGVALDTAEGSRFVEWF